MEQRNSPAGRYALITGASSGFGYEFAKLFAADGFNLILVARNIERLRQVSDEITQKYMVEVVPIEKDLFKAAAAEEIYHEVSAKGLLVNVLVNEMRYHSLL